MILFGFDRNPGPEAYCTQGFVLNHRTSTAPAVLWLAVLFLVVLLWKVLHFRSFGWVSVPIAIALLLALTHYAPVSLQVVMAYGMAWLLLLSGVREATKHGTNAGDALILKRMTHLPRWLWALLWVAGTFGAVYIGWRLLVM